ncbi:MAG TPA: glycosyltransferase [Casimicrobiaceae bacterium]|nr:glycosyltransferase [Casimicrobiaceae bacterium]
MTAEGEPGLRYGIDRMVARGRRVFGWGWIAHPARPIDAVTLVLAGDGWESRLPANHGLVRADVKEAFPQLPDGESSGFVVTGYIPRSPVLRWGVEVQFGDGGKVEIDITAAADGGPARRRLREIGYVLRAVARRLGRGDLRGILQRAREQNYLAPSLDDAAVGRELRERLTGAAHVTVVFDHSMGGGANVYRRTIVDERLAAGATVLLCTYNLPTLDYRLHLMQGAGNSDQGKVFRISSFLSLEAVVAEPAVDELFLNSPVSFDEPLIFVEWLAALREGNPRLRLTVAVNDYFPVCPSFVLLNADGRYCGIPAVTECAACLARHRASYVRLSPPTEIGPWRAIWGRCLAAADEVRCFSQSTQTLLRRAYPSLPARRISVIPHRIDFAPARLPRPDPAQPLTIGIVGQISVQKGALIVKEMLARIDRDALDIRVAVIGALDIRVDSKRLQVTGPYQREDLVDLIEAQRVNMIFFPSICPETFSYVVEEMLRLRLPIVAFDLGAPAERLRGQDNARLCAEVSADAALDTLVDFHRELAARALAVGTHP